MSTDWSQRRYNKLAKIHETTERQLLNTPVRSAKDAIALLDYLEDEDRIEPWHGAFEGTIEASIDSLRTYLAGKFA